MRASNCMLIAVNGIPHQVRDVVHAFARREAVAKAQASWALALAQVRLRVIA